jgi:hypothetical protein
MQIELPDNFASLASAAGFANVEEYICFLVKKDEKRIPSDDDASGYVPLPYDEWKRRFDEFLANRKPGNPNFDDSRASMYPVRPCES